MKKFKNKIYAIVCVILLVISSIVLYSCKPESGFSVYDATGTLVFNESNTEITVEYGEAYNLPMQVQVNGKKVENSSFELYNEAGEKLKLSYGSYTFKAEGVYTVKYIAEEKSVEYKIICKDSILPEVKIISAEYTGSVGSSVALPKFTYSDTAGVEKENVYIEIVSPSGKTEQAQGTELLLEEAGTYAVTIVVKDNNGLIKRETINVEALPIYVDDTKQDNVLYSFDNEDYIGLVTTFNGDTTITRKIVQEGYPALNDEAEDNGVLEISSTKSFGDIYTRFLMHEEIAANSGYRIIIRFALSTDTDYVKVFRNYKNLGNSEIIGQCVGVKANTWYEMEINPLDYGLYVNVEDFALLYRDSGDTVMYIDEIYFTEMPFTDTEIAENVIADFDEDGYLYYVYDNIFKDPTTDHGKRVPGSEFSLVDTAEAPAANGDGAKTPGLGTSGKALKMVVFDKFMGLNYFFPEKINVKDIVSLTLRSYIEKRPNSIIFGCFNEKGYDVGQTLYYSTSLVVGEWFDWVIPGEVLKQFTTTEEISGIYLQFTFANTAVMQNTMYIDEIFTVTQNTTSEQLDAQIATFEDDNSLANVGQNVTKGTATIGWIENVNDKEGVLSVKSNNSTDGFSYYFDEPVTMSVGALNIVAYMPKENTVSKVSVYGIVDGRDDVLVADFDNSYFSSGEFVALPILAQDVLEKNSTGKLFGLRFVITTGASSNNNVLYVDEIYLFDVSTDVENPEILGVDVAPINILAGNSADLSSLIVNISDDKDPSPRWILVAVEDETGNSIADEDALNGFKCMPTKSGVYKVSIKALDWAENESPIFTVSMQINIMESSKEWYLNALNFNSTSDIALVQNSYYTPTIKKDGEKTVLSAGFGAKSKGGYPSTLTIDLGGIYKVSEIENIVITLRVPEIVGSAGSTFYKAGANVTSSSSSSEISISSASVSNGTAKPTVTSDYITIPITGEQLATALGSGDTVVNNIALWNTTSGGAQYPVNVYIDSIVINEKVEEEVIENYTEALLFNSEKSLSLVENSYINSASGFNAASIVTDGGRTVLSACLGAKAHGGYASTLTIGIGGKYKASEIESIVITLRVPELTGSAGSTFYKAGANVTSSSSSSEISISSASVSNGTAKPTVTSDYITIPITGAQLATALGGGDMVVNNIALWNNTSGGTQYPVHVYIDSIVINLVQTTPIEKDLLQFDDEDSLAIVEKSYINTANGFNAASIVADGGRTVLSACFGAKASGGYNSTLTIDIGGKYKASEIASIVITLRVPELTGSAGSTFYKAGANVTASSSSSEISISSASVSNGTAKPTVTSDYITIPITGEQLATALGSGDTVVNNIALWNNLSGGAQYPVHVYIDSIVINLA